MNERETKKRGRGRGGRCETEVNEERRKGDDEGGGGMQKQHLCLGICLPD